MKRTTVNELHEINRKLHLIMATLQDISAAVSAQTTVEQSVVTLLQELSSELSTAMQNNDPAAMASIVANIQANTKVLSDAVTANTPASPAPATPAPAPAAS